MEKVTTIKFTNEDIQMLKRPIPDNQCEICSDAGACCGCPTGKRYEDAVKPYKDAGIYAIAIMLRRKAAIRKEIEKLNAETEKIDGELRRLSDDFLG